MSFANHFAQAEEWLRTKGALPLIEESGLDFSAEIAEIQSDYWAIQSSFSQPSSGAVVIVEADVLDLLPAPSTSFAPEHDPSVPSQRLVALSFLWQLSLMSGASLGVDDDTSWAEQTKTDLKGLVEQLDPAACSTVWQVRWELAVATVSGCQDRVDPLVNKWIRLAPSDRRTAIESGARVKFMATMAKETSLLSGRWSVDYPEWESPRPTKGRALLAWLGTSLGDSKRASLDWPFPEELAPQQADLVRDAMTSLLMLEAEGCQLDPLFEVLIAWSSVVVGLRTNTVDLVRQAASRYTRLLEEGVFNSEFEIPTPMLLGALVRCHFWAGAPAVALELAQKWTLEAPKDADAWHMLSRCHREVGDSDACFDAFEHYVRLSESTNQNWETTELLRLALERKDQSRLLAEIDKLVGARERPVARAVLELEWQAFSQLSIGAQEKWWQGVVVACDPAIIAMLGDHRWSLAVTPSAEALNMEFRTRVLRPFIHTLGVTLQLEPLRRAARADHRSRSILKTLEEDRATLGLILDLLGDASRQMGIIGPPLKRWLMENRPDILALISEKPVEDALKRVNELRSTGTHNLGTGEPEWRQVYIQTKKVLEVLVAPGKIDRDGAPS